MLTEDITSRTLDLSLATARPVREIEIDLGSADTVRIPDAHLMFQGEYRKDGFDLVIEDGQTRVTLNDYFRAAKRPALESPDGARLTEDVVAALAVSDHGQRYAQATPPAQQAAIGRVETVTGQATVIRNGTPVVLNQGDLVLKGDVVQTDRGSSLGITFLDGSTFSLGSGARMVLNDMVYQVGGTQNSALINIVQGSVTFLAGQVAKTGEMRVGTPVATMGIRGTLVNAEINADNGQVRFSVIREPNGEVGRYDLIRDGRVVATVSAVDQVTIVSPTGIVTSEPKSFQQQQAEELLVQQVFQIFSLGQANPLLPGTGPTGPGPGGGGGGGGGSSTDPNLNGGASSLPGGGGPSGVTPPGSELPPNPNGNPGPSLPGQNPPLAAGSSSGQGGSTPSNGSGPPDLVIEPQVVGMREDELATGEQGSLLGTGGTGSGQRVVAVRFADGTEIPVTSGAAPTTVPGNFGTLSIGENGAYSYVPLRANSLAEGEHATESFTYVVRDASGRTTSTTVTFEITGENDAPTVSGPISAATAEGAGQHSVDLLASATDVDHGASLHVENLFWAGHPPGQLPPGVSLSPDGHTLAVDANHAAYDRLGAGQTQSFTVSFDIVDEHGARLGQTATVVVTGTNDAATISGDTTGSVLEAAGTSPGQPTATGTLASRDVDNDPDAFQPANGIESRYGTFTISTSGNWRYVLDNTNAVVDGLDGDDPALTDTFIVYSVDGTPQTITITISGASDETNTPPVLDLNGDSDGVDVSGSYGSGTFYIASQAEITDSDPDAEIVGASIALQGAEGNDRVFVDEELARSLGVSVSGNNTQTLTLSGEASGDVYEQVLRSAVFTAASGVAHEVEARITVSDGQLNGVASATSRISIANGNRAPQAYDDEDFQASLLSNSSFSTTPDFSGWLVTEDGSGNITSGYNPRAIVDRTGAIFEGDDAVATLSFDGNIDTAYGYAWGPSIRSNTFTAEAGDEVRFVWRLSSGGDYALGHGYIRDASNGQIVATVFDYNVGFSGSQSDSESIALSVGGTFYLDFQVGSYDATGGLYVGAELDLGYAGIVPEINEDEVLVIQASDLLANDVDPDGDVLSISDVSDLSERGATLTLSNGTIFYDPRSALNDLEAGETILDSFTYTVVDSAGALSTATVTFTVHGRNDPGGTSSSLAPSDVDQIFSSAAAFTYDMETPYLAGSMDLFEADRLTLATDAGSDLASFYDQYLKALSGDEADTTLLRPNQNLEHRGSVFLDGEKHPLHYELDL